MSLIQRLKTTRFELGLRSQILLSLIVLMVAAIFFVGIFGIRLSERYIVGEKVEMGRMTAQIASILISQSRDKESIREIIAPFMTQRGVKRFIVYDKVGRALLRGGTGGFEPILNNSEIDRLMRVKEEIEIRRGSLLDPGDEVIFSAPLRQRDKFYGIIKMLIPLDDIRGELTYAQRLIILYALIYSVIIVVFGFYLLKKVIINPIQRLEGAAERVAKGGLNEVIELKRGDEIGGLARSFNMMRESLVEKLEALKKANRELLDVQRQIIHTEKMASLGRLSSSIAHEIGNPLGAILGYIDILIQGVDTRDEELEILERIGEEIARIREILRRLLDFSRPSTAELKLVNVNEVVTRSLELMRGSLKGIEVKLDIKRDIPSVKVDPKQLEQVLLNIFINAKDSMPHGGTLSVSTGEEASDYRPSFFSGRRKTDPPDKDFTRERRLPPILKGSVRWVKISISDTGSGMDESTLRQIFTPFFTTKETGRGTGLGLSISLGIVQAFGGDIRVSSSPGEGSTFDIILPAEKGNRENKHRR